MYAFTEASKTKPNKPNQTQFKLEANLPPKGAEIPTGELPGILKPGTNQTRSEFVSKGAEIPTGELLGILKPGTKHPHRLLRPLGKSRAHTALCSGCRTYGPAFFAGQFLLTIRYCLNRLRSHYLFMIV